MTKSPLASFSIADSLTYGSLACTVASLHVALTGNVFWAAMLWCGSAILDNFDGKFASLFQRSQHQRRMGAELDSFTDLAAFGVAPIVGVMVWTQQQAPTAAVMSLGVCLLYLLASVLRLAYFNVRNTEGVHDFVGLPTTEASVFVAAFFLLPALTLPVLLLAVVAVALAMVAPVTIKRPHWSLIVVLAVVIVAVMSGLFLKGA